jgi:hypothetical protein
VVADAAGDREQLGHPRVQLRDIGGQRGVGLDQSVQLRAKRLVLAPRLSDGGHVAT